MRAPTASIESFVEPESRQSLAQRVPWCLTCSHFCIWVDSFEKTSKELDAAGFPGHLTDGGSEVKPGLTPGHHMRASMIWDPEGNPIEVFELAEAP